MELPDLSSSILAGAWRGLNYQLDQEKREAIVSCIMITNTATDTHNHSHTGTLTFSLTHAKGSRWGFCPAEASCTMAGLWS